MESPGAKRESPAASKVEGGATSASSPSAPSPTSAASPAGAAAQKPLPKRSTPSPSAAAAIRTNAASPSSGKAPAAAAAKASPVAASKPAGGASSGARREGAAPVSEILKGCEVFINPALDLDKMEQYRKLVREHGGGVQYYFEASKTTHAITADLDRFADLAAARKADIHLVTPLWLENSVRFGEPEDEEFYSPDPHKFFSGLCVCSSQITVKERDMMFAGVVAFGGRVSARLNSRCTHLVMNTPASGAKYEWARKHGGIKVVTPKWYNNSLTFQRLEKEEAYAVTDELATSKDAPAGATSTVRREQAKKEAEADKQKGKAATSHKPGKDEKSQKAEKPADIMEEDEVKPKEDKKKRKEDEKEDALDQSGVNQSSEWTNPMDRDEEDYDSGARDKATSADEGKDEFNLMLGLQRDKRARTGDEAGRDEGEEREAKLMKTTEGKKLEKGDDDEGEADAGEDEGDDDLGGEGEEEDEEEFMETSSGGRTVSRAAQLEEDIKTYIRKNAHRVSARELRIKFKMGHPRAKRILNEVIQEMKKELKKHTKKRQSSDLDDVKVDKPEAAAAKQETEEKEKEKEAPKKKTTTTATTPNKENKPTTSTAAAATAKEDVVAKVPKNQLMKGMCVLLIDLSSSRYRDALEAVREMGGTTFRGLPDTCKIEGVQWKNVVETKITHVLYPHPKPAIDALKKKMELYGLHDVQEVSIEWVQWCDVHVRMFAPRISPLFQPLPEQPVPGMEELTISQSNTRGWEREEIVALISKMGAKYNRSMPNEANVILIIAAADAGAAKSEKVVMAKEWNVPIVTREWLYECARKWRRVDPVAENYVVSFPDLEGGETAKPDNTSDGKKEKGKKKSKGEGDKDKKAGKSIKEQRTPEELDENDEHDDKNNAKGTDALEEKDVSVSKKAPPRPRETTTTKRCSQCGATKTPCWRKGADGERSLCNACGLKFSAELRRKTNKHDTRKRKRDVGGSFDDFDDDDDDMDDLRSRASKRRSLTSSGGAGKRRRRSGADDMDEGELLIDEDDDGAGGDEDIDVVRRRVRRMMASQDSKARHHFAFSCLTKSTTAQLKRIVTKLGGTYSEMWEPGVTTHLILGTLRRTEKMLCACASGSWVLQPSYLTKSDKKGRFVSEEEHEWYEEDWDDEQEKRIWAGCMRRHRLNLLETGRRSFEGWEVHLVGDTEPLPEIMARIIESGGGKLLSTRSLVKLKKHKEHRYGLVGANADQKSVRRLTEVGLPCVDSIYLATFLCDRHAPAMEDFYI